MTDPKPDDRSCWSCTWQELEGMTFLGFCTKPARNNPTGKKEIPPHIVDTGCAFWQRQSASQMAAEGNEAPQTDR